MGRRALACSAVLTNPFLPNVSRASVIRLAVLRTCAATFLLACGSAANPGLSGPPGAGVLSSVQITSGSNTVSVGATLSLSATAKDGTGATIAGGTIAWSSSAPSVATVSTFGMVTGVSAGIVSITASSGAISGTTQITVTPDDTPASITLAPSGAIALVSGSTFTLVATVRAPDGRVVPTATVVYNSSDVTVASVTAGVVTGAKAGTAMITATSGAAGALVVVTVSPGPAAALGMRVQPAGSVAGSPLVAQPLVEIRDRAGNLVPAATNAVTVAIATGGGSLSGATTVNAAGGVATFTNLVLSGTAGTRTLSFSATGLTPVTSSDVALSATATPSLVIDTTSVALSAPSGKTSQAVTLGVKNGGTTPLTGVTISPPAYDAGQPGGWLSVSAVGGAPPFTLTLQANAASLPAGSYRAIVQVNAPAASNAPVAITVTLSVSPANTITYGNATEKLRILDVAAAYTPTLSARDGTGQPLPLGSTTFASRASSVATVDGQGKITAVGEGTTWVVVQATGSADSVFVTVPRSGGGPVLRSDLTTYLVKAGDTTFVNVLIDARQTPVGAATVAVGYTSTATPVFKVTYTIPAGPPVPVASSTTAGVIRVSVASATPLTGQTTLLRLRIVTPTAALSGIITLTVTDIVAPDGSDLTSVTTSTRIPIIVQ